MEEEIKAEFNKNGFTLDEEQEILQKCECSFSFPFLPSNPVRILPQLVPFLIFFYSLRSYILHSVQAQSFQPRFELGTFLSQQVQDFFQPVSDWFSTIPSKTNWRYGAFQLSLLWHLASQSVSLFLERSQGGIVEPNSWGLFRPNTLFGFSRKTGERMKQNWMIYDVWYMGTSPLHQPKKRHFF